MKRYQLKLFNGSEFSNSILIFQRKANEAELEFQSSYLNARVQDAFPFLALNKIRMKLEEMGIEILCNGSRIDVYPSGMLMMSLKAYELEMGKKAEKMVNIFNPTDDVHDIGTIKEQKDYFDNWFVSIPL